MERAANLWRERLWSVGAGMSRKTRRADEPTGPACATISKIVGDKGSHALRMQFSAYYDRCSSDPSATSTLRPAASPSGFSPQADIRASPPPQRDKASRWDPAPAERKRFKLTTRSLFPDDPLRFGMIVPVSPEPLLQRLGAAIKLRGTSSAKRLLETPIHLPRSERHVPPFHRKCIIRVIGVRE